MSLPIVRYALACRPLSEKSSAQVRDKLKHIGQWQLSYVVLVPT